MNVDALFLLSEIPGSACGRSLSSSLPTMKILCCRPQPCRTCQRVEQPGTPGTHAVHETGNSSAQPGANHSTIPSSVRYPLRTGDRPGASAARPAYRTGSLHTSTTTKSPWGSISLPGTCKAGFKGKRAPWEIAKAFDHSAVVSPFVDLPVDHQQDPL